MPQVPRPTSEDVGFPFTQRGSAWRILHRPPEHCRSQDADDRHGRARVDAQFHDTLFEIGERTTAENHAHEGRMDRREVTPEGNDNVGRDEAEAASRVRSDGWHEQRDDANGERKEPNRIGRQGVGHFDGPNERDNEPHPRDRDGDQSGTIPPRVAFVADSSTIIHTRPRHGVPTLCRWESAKVRRRSLRSPRTRLSRRQANPGWSVATHPSKRCGPTSINSFLWGGGPPFGVVTYRPTYHLGPNSPTGCAMAKPLATRRGACAQYPDEMFKPGIWKPSQFEKARTWFGLHRMASVTLLDTPAGTRADQVARFEGVLQDARMGSGVFRTTFRGRFADLDRVVTSILKARFSDRPLVVHDWACSHAVTSVEWAERLFAEMPDVRLIASDNVLFVWALKLRHDTIVFQPDGVAIQYVRPPFVVPLSDRENRVLVLNRLAARVGKLRAQDAFSRHWPPNAGRGAPWTQISLVHPEARAFATCERRFELIQHDAFKSLPTPVDVIRTMNIYNLTYFTPARIREGARAVWESLVPNGLWVVGRTSTTKERRNDASILERRPEGWTVRRRLNRGSEIEEHLDPRPQEDLWQP
jgi:hypothetical protein